MRTTCIQREKPQFLIWYLSPEEKGGEKKLTKRIMYGNYKAKKIEKGKSSETTYFFFSISGRSVLGYFSTTTLIKKKKKKIMWEQKWCYT